MIGWSGEVSVLMRGLVRPGSKIGMEQATPDAAIHTLNANRISASVHTHLWTLLVHGFLVGHVISYL